MATISTNVAKEYIDAYDGFDMQAVGIGLQTGTYASPSYAKRKVQNLALGLISEIVYSGFFHDTNPKIIPLKFEPNFNTILAINLNYVPETYRRAILKFIIDSNQARIRDNQPILIDWHSLKRSVPVVQYITRRYKTTGIRIVEGNIPLSQWPDIIKGNNKWQNHYKVLQG